MVKLPWRGDPEADVEEAASGEDDDAIVDCEFQDGTLSVYENEVVIVRPSKSRFSDVTIPMDRIFDVEYAKGITIGYLQIELVGREPDTGGWFSDPVNENTVHFGRRGRDCARTARDEILARAG